ncbi:MAG TPA: nucleoid-associated protein [Gammaproteobacteria bacterium]|nr:nucleoid-associated protein [Chromatiales bacterium]HPQ25071.1 nucleoid-associated protein [Gammaproteobacteria bacterium]
MPKESVLTPAEKASIQIRYFIFHILIAGNENPTTLSEVELTDEQRQFFCDRLAQAAEGTQFVFSDRAASTPQRCERMLQNPADNFVDESIGLAQDFLNHHRRNMSDGVFIVALVDIQRGAEQIPLISLIKIDHTRVLEYQTQETATGLVAKLHEVINTFVEDKKALQKVALLDHGQSYGWDVLASDRNSPDKISEYFRKFLSVTEREHDSHWTREAVRAVTAWAFENEGALSDDASGYKHRAITYMDTHAVFETDGFIDMVLNEGDPQRRAQLHASLHDGLAHRGIAGQTFSPKPGSLTKTAKRNKWVTVEGVTVEWEGDADAAGVAFEELDGGRTRIVIDTSGYRSRT